MYPAESRVKQIGAAECYNLLKDVANFWQSVFKILILPPNFPIPKFCTLGEYFPTTFDSQKFRGGKMSPSQPVTTALAVSPLMFPQIKRRTSMAVRCASSRWRASTDAGRRTQQIRTLTTCSSYAYITSWSSSADCICWSWRAGYIYKTLYVKSRLHVQAAHHRQQQRRQDVVSVPLLGRLVYVVVRQHGRHRLQGQDRPPARQTHQTTDLGTCRRCRVFMT